MVATRSLLSHCCMLATLLAAPLVALAQGTTTTPNPAATGAKTIGVPSTVKGAEALIVLNARGASLSGRTLALEGTLPSAILFADRPARRAGHIATTEVVDLWTSGSFAKDPPNATVSAFRADGSAVSDAVVVLKHPRLEGETLSFEVAVLEGDLGKADGPVSVFIDTIWFGIGSGGISYLGRNRTTGGTAPSVYDSSLTGWSNPAPDAPPRPSWAPSPETSLATPPELGGSSTSYRASCGAPPLLPCY